MSMAAITHTPSCRRLLASAPAVLALSGAAIAAPVTPNPDADLIRVCRQFAEAELTGWYRYVTAPDNVADEQIASDMWVFDRAAWEWIAAMPATTPEGWQAKALAFVALDRNAYDDAEDCDRTTPVLASLLRDMVRPARAAIIARLTRLYGPLPDGYTADGMWLGAETRA